MTNENIAAVPGGCDEAVDHALTSHMWDASDDSLCSCGWSPDNYFATDAESDRKYVRDELVNAEEGDEPDFWAPVIAEFVAHQRDHVLAALSSAGFLATEQEWAVKVPWPRTPQFVYRGFDSEADARASVFTRKSVVSRRVAAWTEGDA
jgi:hypothetical protein